MEVFFLKKIVMVVASNSFKNRDKMRLIMRSKMQWETACQVLSFSLVLSYFLCLIESRNGSKFYGWEDESRSAFWWFNSLLWWRLFARGAFVCFFFGWAKKKMMTEMGINLWETDQFGREIESQVNLLEKLFANQIRTRHEYLCEQVFYFLKHCFSLLNNE